MTTKRIRTNTSRGVAKNKKGRRKRQNKASKTYLYDATGILHGSGRGFAFVVAPDVGDIFVAEDSLNGATHGDNVKVKVYSQSGKVSGRVIAIVEKSYQKIVGLLRVRRGNIGFVETDDKRFGDSFVVESEHRNGAIDGDKIIIEPIDSVYAKVLTVLGQSNAVGMDILSITAAYGLSDKFDKSVLAEVACIPRAVDRDSIGGRVDCREHIVVTIDGDDTKDIDDAVSLIRQDGGGYLLSVHIADVTHYVRHNSALDKEALQRGTSVYFADRVIPMLPPQLSNGICSLNPGVDRLCLSIDIKIDSDGNVQASRLYESVIQSRQLTYSVVTEILKGDCGAQYIYLRPMLLDMLQLTEILLVKRRQRGSIDFDISEAKISLDREGNPIDIAIRKRDMSHKIIEEFMILANECVAKQLDEPFVYRTHLAPDETKMSNLLNFCKAMGIQLNANIDDIRPKDIQDMLSSADSSILSPLSTIALRSMMKASYEPHNLGHFGLALDYYCHFTSPIRRYPDLIIHRIIKAHLNKSSVDMYKDYTKLAARQSSVRERIAVEVERKVSNMLKAKYMSGRIGEVYSGRISGVISSGFFVELDNTVEGMVRIEDLPSDRYSVDEKLMRINSSRLKLRLGDSVQIMIKGVVEDRISFAWIGKIEYPSTSS